MPVSRARLRTRREKKSGGGLVLLAGGERREMASASKFPTPEVGLD